jgi:ATP-dependent Clp protease ATP-binding subunit ClpA
VQLVFSKISIKLKNTIVVAQSEAYQMGHISVAPEHFILALAIGKDEVGLVLHQQGVDPDALRKLIWKDTSSFERTIVDIQLDMKANVMMKVASDFVDWNTLDEVTTAHVLKALLLEHAICSVVEMLKSLNVDLETLRRRTEIILKLLERPAADPSVVAPSPQGGDDAASSFSPDFAQSPGATQGVPVATESKLSVKDVFDDASIKVIQTAQNSARLLGHSVVRVDHLLCAFVNLGFWRESVAEMTSHVRDEHQLSVNMVTTDSPDDSPLDFAGETRSVLVAARELAKLSSTGLIEPMMILYAIACECSPALFNDAAHDKLRELSQKLRQDVVDELENRNIANIREDYLHFPDRGRLPDESQQESPCLLLTERLIRVLRFAKAEAMLSRQIVQAPHLVLAMIRESLFSEISVVARRELEIENLRAAVCRANDIFTRPINMVAQNSVLKLAPRSRGLLLLARDKARELRVPYIDLNHLALALLEAEDWLRPLIQTSEFTNATALAKTLKQCSLHQHHQLQSGFSTHTSSVGLPMTLNEIDDDIEPWLPPGPLPLAKKSIEELLNSRSEIVMGFAVLESKRFGHSQISIETIMLGLLYETFGPSYDVFTLLGLNLEDARKIFASCCDRISERTATFRPLSRNASRIMERAWTIAELMKSTRIAPEHILLAIAEESEGVASFVCDALAIDGHTLRADIIAAMHAPPTQSDPQPAD